MKRTFGYHKIAPLQPARTNSSRGEKPLLTCIYLYILIPPALNLSSCKRQLRAGTPGCGRSWLSDARSHTSRLGFLLFTTTPISQVGSKKLKKGWTRDDKANENGRKELKQSNREEEELSPQPLRGMRHGEGRSCEVTAGATPAWVSFTGTRIPTIK